MSRLSPFLILQSQDSEDEDTSGHETIRLHRKVTVPRNLAFYFIYKSLGTRMWAFCQACSGIDTETRHEQTLLSSSSSSSSLSSTASSSSSAHSSRVDTQGCNIGSIDPEKQSEEVETAPLSRSDSEFNLTNYPMSVTFLETCLAFTFCYEFQHIIHNPFCNFLFRCGCTWQWAGGWKNCNIWFDGPKCPWCMSRASISWTTDYLIFALMLLTFVISLRFRKYFCSERWAMFCRWTLPVIVYFTVGSLVGLVFKLSTDYPYFIF